MSAKNREARSFLQKLRRMSAVPEGHQVPLALRIGTRLDRNGVKKGLP